MPTTGVALLGTDNTEGKRSLTSYGVSTKHKFNATGWTVETGTTAHVFDYTYTDQIRTYLVPEGAYYFESDRDFNDQTYISSQSSDGDSSWYESTGSSGEIEHGDYPDNHPLYNYESTPYYLSH